MSEPNIIAEEHKRRQTNRDAVADYFREHTSEWIEAATLADVGGTLAWRTRVSEARLKLGMYIENRIEKDFVGGSLNVRSFYRYLPQALIGPPADEPRDGTLFNLSGRGNMR